MLAASAAWMLVLSTLVACDPRPASKPNILILSLDTLRADHLGLYGHARATSPNLDRLASTSVVFDHALAQSTATLPSHHSLFQSRLPSDVRLDLPTLAELLDAGGYETVGLTDGGFMSREYGFARGFDRYAEFRGGLRRSLPALEAWLRAGAREPWYVFLHTYDIHEPYAPPPPYDTMFYPDYDGPVTPASTSEICRKIRRLFEYASFEGEVELTEADRRKIETLYDGAIRYTDELVGRLLKLLEDGNHLEDSVLVILSDHGEEFWDHGSVLHGHSLYQELIRVPLVVRLPAARHGGRRVPRTVRLMDVAPTLLELAGLRSPASFQGQSLANELEGRGGPHRAAVSEMGTLKARVEMPWKLITDTQSREPALFNLVEDPRERSSLAHRRRDRVGALSRALRQSLPGEFRQVPAVPAQQVPEELREQLRALGYVE